MIGARQVIYQTPLGTPPASGWPVVLVYQGSFFPLDNFTYYSNQPFGGFYEGKLIRTLLDNGYAVIAPSAPADLFWQTNIPGLAQAYELSTDYDFLGNVLAAIAAGHFGPLNAQRQLRHRHQQRRLQHQPHGGVLPRRIPRLWPSSPAPMPPAAGRCAWYRSCPPTTRRPCSCMASSMR